MPKQLDSLRTYAPLYCLHMCVSHSNLCSSVASLLCEDLLQIMHCLTENACHALRWPFARSHGAPIAWGFQQIKHFKGRKGLSSPQMTGLGLRGHGLSGSEILRWNPAPAQGLQMSPALQVHAEGEAEHAAIGHAAVVGFVPAQKQEVLRRAMLDHDRDFAVFYNILADMLE